MSSNNGSSPLKFERYELKYLIAEEQIEEISQYIGGFCQLDPYANEDGFYLINSLYLDTPQYHLFKKSVNGEDNRFNVRIRCYGSAPRPPFYLEIKHKKNGFVYKYRYPIAAETWQEFFEGKDLTPIGTQIDIDAPFFNLFERLGIVYGLGPKILTQYRRKAYVSLLDDYARITFDRDLRYENAETFCLTPNDKAMTHYDNPLIFPDGANVILELKCTTHVPLWMIDLIHRFNLERRGFSKFTSSVKEMTQNTWINSLDRVANKNQPVFLN